MVLASAHTPDREQAHVDRRAVAVAVLIHVLLVAALLNSRPAEARQPALESMALVSLRDATTPAPRVEQPPTSFFSATVASEANRGRAKIAAGIRTAGSQARINASGCSGPRFRGARVQSRFKPDYPREAFLAKEQGSVDVIIDLAADGKPVKAKVYQSSGSKALDEAAVAGALKYTFSPATRDGEPTRSQAIVTIDWTIGPDVVRHFEAMDEDVSNKSSRVEAMKKVQCLHDNTRSATVHMCQDAGENHRRR